MERIKKILYIYHNKIPWEIRIDKICKALSNNGFDVLVLSRYSNEDTDNQDYEYFSVYRFGKKYNSIFSLPISINPFWKNAIRKTILDYKPDLIIAREIMLFEAAFSISKKNNIPIIIDMAENYPAALRHWKFYNDNLFLRFIVHNLKIPDIIEKNCVRDTDGIITVCSEQNNRLYEQYKFPDSKIAVVHNTPELDLYNHNSNKSFNKPRIFCHHGYLTAEKNIDVFLKGFIIAAQTIPDIQFIIAGDGDCIDDLKRVANNSTCINRIHFLGRYNFSELANILDKADIGVIPYQLNDFNNYTIHNKIFDYFSAGIPVVSSAMPPFLRLAKETKAVEIYDFSTPEMVSDSINKICNTDFTTLANNAYKAFKNKYNWAADTKVLIDFINKYINN